MLTVRKTTLSDHNQGICGSRNNCRYTGHTVCWAIDHGDNNLIAVSRKMDAELIAATINDNEPDWDGWNSYCPIDKARSFLKGADKCDELDQLNEAKEV